MLNSCGQESVRSVRNTKTLRKYRYKYLDFSELKCALTLSALSCHNSESDKGGEY